MYQIVVFSCGTVVLLQWAKCLYAGFSGCKGSHPTIFFAFLGYSSEREGGGGLGRSKSFESLFLCPEAIKSKQSQCAKRLKTVKKLF